MLTGTDSLVLGDFNAHRSFWHSGTTNTRGNQLDDSVSISSFAVQNTRLPGNADPSSPDVSLTSASLITSSEWQTHTTMNDEITKTTSDHKRRRWREIVESIDHRTDSTKLWRTIKGIDVKSKQTEENEGITFTGRPHTSTNMIAISFTCQFTLLSWASTLHRGGLVRCRRM